MTTKLSGKVSDHFPVSQANVGPAIWIDGEPTPEKWAAARAEYDRIMKESARDS
jgi:hypothetical protein